MTAVIFPWSNGWWFESKSRAAKSWTTSYPVPSPHCINSAILRHDPKMVSETTRIHSGAGIQWHAHFILLILHWPKVDANRGKRIVYRNRHWLLRGWRNMIDPSKNSTKTYFFTRGLISGWVRIRWVSINRQIVLMSGWGRMRRVSIRRHIVWLINWFYLLVPCGRNVSIQIKIFLFYFTGMLLRTSSKHMTFRSTT